MVSTMPVSRTKTRKKKQDVKRDLVPQVVTKNLSDNVYTGIIRESAHGAQFLDGSSTYVWSTGIKYEGPFCNSHIDGKGKFSWPDGSTYEGNLQNGKRHGEGVYVGADGVTKYEGQWLTGKRHGRGKLIYNKDGSSFYEGLFLEGMKHGEGHQVWASGNEFSGQWQKGTMRGRGRMIWRTAVGVEEYSGEWEDNQPHGDGTHIWHPLESKLSLSENAPPSPVNDTRQVQRQLNNRYAGQFVFGKRNGTGTFYYANGSYYTGEWRDHAKNGRGRHVFEDGSLYEGLFVNDQMVGPSSANKDPAPVYFAEDNPTCRCTDFSDLEPFAMPPDCSGIPQSQCTGYTDNVKIFREVYNMLLRNYGELKDLYSRYRVLLPIEGEDPYALALVEFWAMANDFDMFTPVCSVARFNRMCFAGIRNHREVAPDDMQEIKPLTPRSADLNLPRRYSLDSNNSGPDRQRLEKAGLGSRPCSQQTEGVQRSEMSEEEESISSSVLPSPGGQRLDSAAHSDRPRTTSRQAATRQARIPDPPASARSDASSRPGGDKSSPAHPSSSAPQSAVADVPASEPTGNFGTRPSTGDFPLHHQTLKDDEFFNITHFRRPDGPRCRKTHDMGRPLLQRQFLEAMVRVSLARFPHERGLESQISRLFKELVSPGLDRIPSSDGPFVCVAEPNVRRALDYFAPVLSQLFGGHRFETFTQPEAGSRPGTTGEVTSPTSAADTSDVSGGVGNPELAPSLASGIRSFGDFAAVERRMSVRARLDVTVRVKDVLKLLDSTGLLCAMPRTALGEIDNAFGCAIPSLGGEFGILSELEGANPSLVQTLAPSSMATRASASATDIQSFTPAATSGGTPATTAASGAINMPAGISGEIRRSSTDGNATTPDGAVPASAPPDPNTQASSEDFAQRDVRCNVADVLRIITGICSPSSVANIRMQLDPDDLTPIAEAVTLLEYLETELIYAEFERILVCLADRALPLEVRERLVPARVLEGFLEFVFIPALSSPYVAPPPEPSESASPTLETQEGESGAGNGEAAAVTEAAGEDASAGATAAAIAGEEQAAATSTQEESSAEKCLAVWHGFDGGSPWARAEACQAPRTWPGGYDLDVANW